MFVSVRMYGIFNVISKPLIHCFRLKSVLNVDGRILFFFDGFLSQVLMVSGRNDRHDEQLCTAFDVNF